MQNIIPAYGQENATAKLVESIKSNGILDPFIVNCSQNRKNIIIGGHFRLEVA